MFANIFCRVFHSDIKIFDKDKKYSEIWITLRESQFIRSIAKFSAFSTEPMIEWIQIIEKSTNLTFEGNSFSLTLFMAKQKEWITNVIKDDFLPFKNSIPLKKALFDEKWIHAINGKNVALTGVGHSGAICGIFNISKEVSEKIDYLVPHENLKFVMKTLGEGKCVFITTDYNDIYLILGNNKTIFFNSKGNWYYINYNNILNTLKKFLDKDVSLNILQFTLNLAFERKGTIIAIPDEDNYISEMIPDYNEKAKSNYYLRNVINGLTITNNNQLELIRSLINTDGALIISKKGKILDIGCMISEPNLKYLNKISKNKLERFSGSRTTASWNASIYGISIKVSDDGQITIYRHGEEIEKLGY
jgi:hypothetical protein